MTSPIVPAPWTFFGAPAAPDLAALDARVAFLGVPFDAGTPQPGLPTGQRAGPAAVREASREILVPGEGWYDLDAGRQRLAGVAMADVGDVVIQGGDTIANHDRIAAAARTVAARGALLVAFGGDHSISFPLGRGLEALGPFDVVHVDAHADFLDELDGARLSGASQLRRLAELPFVDSVSALGLRNVDRSEIDGLRALGGRWATTRDVVERGPSRVVADTVRAGAALYVTVDLDVLDTRSRRAIRCPSRAGSATRSCARCSPRSPAAAAWSPSTWSSSTRPAIRPARPPAWPRGRPCTA